MHLNINQTTANYINHINELNDKVIFYANTIQFQSINLSEAVACGELPLEIQNLENCIYYIELEHANEMDINNICHFIAETKSSDRETKYPKVNFPLQNTMNTILYIGKSKGKLKNRFRTHIKATPKSTFGLHLENWIQNEKFKHISLKLNYAVIDFIKDEERTDDILEILESGLHLHAKPLLGRSGH